MKTFKIYSYSLVLLFSCSFWSCKKDLNIPPAANNEQGQFYKSPADFNQAVLSVYNGLLPIDLNCNWALSDVRSDDTYVTTSAAQRDNMEIGTFTVSSQTNQLQTSWNNLFTIVYRANQVLDKISPFSDFTLKNQYKAEARFLRALAYFDLVRLWGPVPLQDHVLTADEAKTNPRVERKKIYEFIISDLTYAQDSLPGSFSATDKGRATSWAAKALLGKVYLTMAGYPLKQTDKLASALNILGEVIANEGSGYSLAPVYADLFKSANDNKYNVFEVQYISGGQGLGNPLPGEQPIELPKEWADYSPTGFGYAPSRDLIKTWSADDINRRKATIDTSWTVSGKLRFKDVFTKFVEKNVKTAKSRSDWDVNFPVIRYEDVLLMYAEIENELAGNGTVPPADAITKLNRVRTRSGAKPLKPATKEEFRSVMERERRCEFAGEGLRWHDLVRTGRAVEVMNKFNKISGQQVTRDITENDLIYPIPFKEMNINPGFWKQNQGYN